MTDNQIDGLGYDDSTGLKVVRLSSRNKLRILRSWHYHLQQVQGVRLVDWFDGATVNKDKWEEFRVGVYIVPGNIPPNPDTTPFGPPSSPSIGHTGTGTTFLSSFHNRHSNVGPCQANIMGQQQFDNYNKEDGDEYGETKTDIEDDYFGSVRAGVTRPQGREQNNHHKRSSLPKAILEVFSENRQIAWDSISNQDKSKIIVANKDHMKRSDGTTNKYCVAQVHESVTPADTSISDVDLFEDMNQGQSDDINTTFLTQAVTQKPNVVPADIRNQLNNTYKLILQCTN